jgi:opacity protein-like surface antigen
LNYHFPDTYYLGVVLTATKTKNRKGKFQMKKIIISSLVAVFAVSAANAEGFYISPKLSANSTNVKEARVEKKVVGGEWAEFAGNKSEKWDDKGTQITPKFAVGYDFDLKDAGILSVEAEYGETENYFNPMNGKYDLDGNTPNDTDTRNFTYGDKTISLNVKYGYKIESIIPYITAGVGYSVIDSQNNFRSGTYWWDTKAQDKNLSWNIGAGVEVPVAEKVSLTLSYLYTDLGSVDYSNWMYHETGSANGIERHFDSKVDLSKHEFLAGVKIAF